MENRFREVLDQYDRYRKGEIAHSVVLLFTIVLQNIGFQLVKFSEICRKPLPRPVVWH